MQTSQLVGMDVISAWVPHWIIGLAIMAGAGLVVFAAYRWFIGRLIGLVAHRSPFLHRLLQRGQQPVGAVLVILALGIALPAAQFPYEWAVTAGHILLIALVLALGWTASKALDIGAELYLRQFRTDTEDNLLARKHVTQVNILRRAAQTLLVIVTIATALMTVETVRQYGVSLFASAGAAGLVVGLAARPVLSNLLAGIQIAMTQPIRVEDSVIVEGEFGWIETITSTYVVIRIWDLRRLVVPLTYFIEKPFQNWTYQTSNLIGPVILHVDYTAPIDRLREKLQEIVQGSELWDGKVAGLQVTDSSQNTLELRALVSGRNAGDTFNLRCLVREKLIAFLQSEHAHALPRQRTEVAGPIDPADREQIRRAAAASAAASGC
jgi:small-conductance mechanosensitive channel